MTTDITKLAQSLKAAAEKATPGAWGIARDGKTVVSNQSHPVATISDAMHRVLADGTTGQDAEFIALANPTNILALVEVQEKAQRSANISNQWKPDVCPITSRRFFMWIEHPEFGYVPTYGGPYDSYTIPTRDSDGEFSCERYDHDVGGWVDGECIGLYLVDDDELCDVDDLKSRIAELESFRTAYMEWSDKTDWVRDDRRFDVVKPLGKHLADVLKAYIEHLESCTVKLPKPHAHLIWIQAGYAPDDFWDEVAVSNSEEDRCCDGSERYPVYAHWEIEEMLTAAGIKLEAE